MTRRSDQALDRFPPKDASTEVGRWKSTRIPTVCRRGSTSARAICAKARAFYGDLFGWDIQEGPPEAGGYSIAHFRGKPVAGLGPQQNPGPPHWTVYINVDSADDAATTMADNGGQVFMPPFDVMDVGRMAIGADPTGAPFGLWEPKQHKGAGIVNEPNTFSWAELVTDDVDTAKSFYTSVFGWTAETYGEGEGAYTEAKLGDRSVAGMLARPPTYPPKPRTAGVCTSPSRTPTKRPPGSASSAARSSFRRWTSSPDASPSSPIRPGVLPRDHDEGPPLISVNPFAASWRWWIGSWTKYRANVSMVNTAPSLRRPVRAH